jgi:hypothetical protein
MRLDGVPLKLDAAAECAAARSRQTCKRSPRALHAAPSHLPLTTVAQAACIALTGALHLPLTTPPFAPRAPGPPQDQEVALKVLGAALLVAYALVYDALEAAVARVFEALKDNSQLLVQHRWLDRLGGAIQTGVQG